MLTHTFLPFSSSMSQPVSAVAWSDFHLGHSEHALGELVLPWSLSQPTTLQSYIQAGELWQARWTHWCQIGWLHAEGIFICCNALTGIRQKDTHEIRGEGKGSVRLCKATILLLNILMSTCRKLTAFSNSIWGQIIKAPSLRRRFRQIGNKSICSYYWSVFFY